MEIQNLPRQNLLQLKSLLEKYFYSAGTNIALKRALGSSESNAFREKVVRVIKNQILHIAQLDTVIELTKGISKADQMNNDIVGKWKSFSELIPGGQTTVIAFLLWAGDQGGQAALDKMLPNAAFDLKNPELVSQLEGRSAFLLDALDKTGINWTNKVIEMGVKKGLSAIEIVKQMRKIAPEVAAQRGDVITENELIRAMNLIENATYKNNGIEKIIWKTAEDERVDDACVANEEAGAINLGEFFPSGHETPPAHFLCYNKDMEVYTNRGWVSFKDVKGDENFMSLDPDSLEIKWSKADHLISYPYQGKMIHFHHFFYDLMVTPDHQMLAGFRIDHGSKGRKMEWKFIEAKELIKKQEFYLLRVPGWNKHSSKTIMIKDKLFDYNDFAKFMGYFLSEGSIVSRKRKKEGKFYEIAISQSKLSSRMKMFDDIKNMPFRKIYLGKDKIYIRDKSLEKYLLQFGHADKKYVPVEIKEASTDIIMTFLNAYLLGDGTRQFTMWRKKDLKSVSKKFITSSKRMADDLGELIFKIDCCPGFSFINTKGKMQKFGNGVYQIKTDTYHVRVTNSKYVTYQKGRSRLKIDFVDYNDLVYGVQLKKYHILLVRRNNKIAWSGNCRCYNLPVLPYTLKGQVWSGE